MSQDSGHVDELILETEDGNEYGEHAFAVMNDGFIIGYVPILSPGVIGNYRCHR